MKKFVLSALAAATLGLVSMSASATVTTYLPFTVNENTIAGTSGMGYVGTADMFNGTYSEVFTPTSASTFTTSAVWKASSLMLGSNNKGVLGMDESTFGGVGYSIYAVFTSEGTFSQTGSITNFYGNTGFLSIYADSSQDSTYSFVGGVPVFAGTGEDKLLGTSNVLLGAVGQVDSSSAAAGNFDFTFGPLSLIAPDGTAYFTGGAITLAMEVQGNVNDFDPLVTSIIGGSANAGFGNNIPEPGSLALLGLGLAGLGVAQRRRKAAK